MFCVNCGKVLEDDSKFCPYCGNIVKSNAILSDNINDANMNSAVAESIVAPSESSNNVVTIDAPIKKSKRKPILISALAVVVALAIIVGLTFPYISNFFSKTFSSPEEYYQSVEETSADNAVSGIVSAVSTYKKLFQSPKSYKTNISFSLAGKKAMSALMLFDADSQSYYLGVPELTDKYLTVSMPQFNYDNSQAFDTEQLNKLLEALPEDEKLEKLLNAYIDAVLGAVDNVTESTKTVKVEGISEDCTVLTVKLTEKELSKIVSAVLKKAEKDKDLEQILKDFVIAIDPTADADDFYDEFHDGIRGALDELNDIDEDFDSDDYIKIKTYVNSKGNIIGRSFGNDQLDITCLVPSNNDDFGFKFEISSQGKSIAFVGKGTNNDGKIDGNFALKSGGVNYFNIKLIDFEPVTDSNEFINGKIELTFSSEFASLLTASGSAANFDIEDITIAIDLKTSKDKSSIQLSMVNGSAPLFAFIVENEFIDNNASMPSSNECIDLENLNDWLNTFDLEKFKNSLINAGIPSDAVNALIQSLQEAIWEYGSGYDYGDFDYDDFYYDDFDDFNDFDYDDFNFDDFNYDDFYNNDFEVNEEYSEWM